MSTSVNFTILQIPLDVELVGPREAQKCAESLRNLSTTALFGGAHLFRGEIEGLQGRLRFRKRVGFSQSARVLEFELLPQAGGCSFKGRLTTALPLRWFVGIYWSLCCVFTVQQIATMAWFHNASGQDWLKVVTYPVLAIAGFYLWLRFAVWTGRLAEQQMVKILHHVLQSEQSAAIVSDLLSSSR